MFSERIPVEKVFTPVYTSIKEHGSRTRIYPGADVQVFDFWPSPTVAPSNRLRRHLREDGLRGPPLSTALWAEGICTTHATSRVSRCGLVTGMS